MLDLVHLVTSSISMCDAELRAVSILVLQFDYLIKLNPQKSLYSNLMVVGGNSLLIGFMDRLNNEFNRLVSDLINK